MSRSAIRRCGTLLPLSAVAALLVLGVTAGQAAAFTPGCGDVPIVYGIPPWGFHTGSPGGARYARGGGETVYASYNGVRSDSVQFFFPAACHDQDHLYHGTQVNNQVPPL